MTDRARVEKLMGALKRYHDEAESEHYKGDGCWCDDLMRETESDLAAESSHDEPTIEPPVTGHINVILGKPQELEFQPDESERAPDTADLLKRLDKLERFNVFWHIGGHIECVRFEQVKTMVAQWVAEQGRK